MTTLWDTTGTAVVKALGVERRQAGAVSSGLALTLVVVVDEKRVAEAEAAATRAAAQHPCRLLVVVRRRPDAPEPRLDAEVLIGGRLGPGEAVVMRMYGRLALHAESVVLPLLAPDAPVVTWWYGDPPHLIAHDPLGVFADRRVTDSSLGGQFLRDRDTRRRGEQTGVLVPGRHEQLRAPRRRVQTADDESEEPAAGMGRDVRGQVACELGHDLHRVDTVVGEGVVQCRPDLRVVTLGIDAPGRERVQVLQRRRRNHAQDAFPVRAVHAAPIVDARHAVTGSRCQGATSRGRSAPLGAFPDRLFGSCGR